jgi:hypothetical protein
MQTQIKPERQVLLLRGTNQTTLCSLPVVVMVPEPYKRMLIKARCKSSETKEAAIVLGTGLKENRQMCSSQVNQTKLSLSNHGPRLHFSLKDGSTQPTQPTIAVSPRLFRSLHSSNSHIRTRARRWRETRRMLMANQLVWTTSQ